MALDSKNNIKSVFIVPAQSAVATGTKMVPGATTTGSVVITDMSNVVLTTGTGTNGVQNYSKIKIIKDRGANLPLQQVVLDLADVKAVSAVSGAPSTEQVTYIGYNGTSGALTAASNSFYEIKLEHVPNAFAYGKRPANYKYGTFQSTGATAVDIATGLVKSLVQNFVPNRNTDWRVFAELTNNTSAKATAGTGTLTFTKWSKIVKASALAATSAVVVGDYIQSVATVETVGIYKVVAKNTNTGDLTLDIAYNGETITGVSAATNIRTASASIGTDWGIKITGVKQKYDVNRWRQYDKVRFNTFINEPFAATPVTTTAAFDGIGVYEQAANDEYISWGDEGQVFVDQVPPLFREQDAADTQYNPAVISWVDPLPSLIGAGENKGQVIMYFAGALVAGVFTPAVGTQANIVSVFNSWRASSFPATNWPDVAP